MHSIRTKITAMTIGAIIITMVIATIFGVIAIKNIGMSSSEQMLLLLCEAGQKNLDSYFEDLWEKVDVARGMAVYDPKDDESISDVVRRADKLMYENKWRSKHPDAIRDEE